MEDLVFYIVSYLMVEVLGLLIGKVLAPHKSAARQKNIGCLALLIAVGLLVFVSLLVLFVPSS